MFNQKDLQRQRQITESLKFALKVSHILLEDKDKVIEGKDRTIKTLEKKIERDRIAQGN